MADDGENVVELRSKKPASAGRRAAGLKGRDAAKRTNHKPASGMAASGLPAMGAGWGGEASGAPSGPERLALGADAPRRTPEQRALDADRALEKILTVMDTAPEPGLQLMAAVHARNQILGTPTARVITADAADDDAVRVIERRIVDVADPKTAAKG
jgi:hypothetical protein